MYSTGTLPVDSNPVNEISIASRLPGLKQPPVVHARETWRPLGLVASEVLVRIQAVRS